MTKYVCDRCGHEQTTPLQKLDLSGMHGNTFSNIYDLCEGCIYKLMEFAKPQPKPAKEGTP